MRSNLVPAGLLVLLPLVAFYPAMQAGYVWDDDDYVTNNQTLRTADGLRQIWFEPLATPQYYPLVHTSFWVEYQLWETKPYGYHLNNILLQALNAILAWQLLLRLKVPGAWLAAAIFAIHPVHVESVAWITERKNVLSGAFYLASLLAYLRFRTLEPAQKKSEDGSWAWYGLSLCLFVAALLSKSVTGTMPAAILVLVWWKRGRIGGRDVVPLLPMFAIALFAGGYTAYLERYHVEAFGAEWDLSFVERCLIAGRAVWFYAAKLLWPTPLIFIYPRWQIDTGVWWQYVFPIMALLLLIGLWFGRNRLGRGPLAAALLFGGTLFPALGFVNTYPMRYSFVADHFQYLASLSLIALFVGTVHSLVPASAARSAGRVKATAVLSILAMLSFGQSRAYADEMTLWHDTITKNPAAVIAHVNLGIAYYRQDDVDRAVEHYQQALRIDPNTAEAHYNLAAVLVKREKLREAEGHYLAALRVRPDAPNVHFNLAQLYAKQNEVQKAATHYQQAIKLQPDHVEAYNNLGILFAGQGDLQRAIECFERALAADPHFETARNNLHSVRAKKTTE